ncbi:unnamed protein product [Mycena citricolor]|uniref:Uncharacterized protein n=1 Tax=Mycena citricolor TaxID=2018698 RepID=A0AAD2H1U8_9AGAR|nr:unnamed protein product [Mycena citricolor]
MQCSVGGPALIQKRVHARDITIELSVGRSTNPQLRVHLLVPKLIVRQAQPRFPGWNQFAFPRDFDLCARELRQADFPSAGEEAI